MLTWMSSPGNRSSKTPTTCGPTALESWAAVTHKADMIFKVTLGLPKMLLLILLVLLLLLLLMIKA